MIRKQRCLILGILLIISLIIVLGVEQFLVEIIDVELACGLTGLSHLLSLLVLLLRLLST